ncbi:helix-turn-helix domain-containing protein, partial [Roseospira navarrensis]
LGDVVMILDLHRQGLSLSAIARRTGLDRKTVRTCIKRGLEPPVSAPRPPRDPITAPWQDYLRQRLQAVPELTAKRLLREIRDLGYTGGYTAVKAYVRSVRPSASPAFERRFETPAGRQAQVDFAHFRATFTDEPGTERVV